MLWPSKCISLSCQLIVTFLVDAERKQNAVLPILYTKAEVRQYSIVASTGDYYCVGDNLCCGHCTDFPIKIHTSKPDPFHSSFGQIDYYMIHSPEASSLNPIPESKIIIHCDAILIMFCEGDQSVPASLLQVVAALAIQSHALASEGDLLAQELQFIDVLASKGDSYANFIVASIQSSKSKSRCPYKRSISPGAIDSSTKTSTDAYHIVSSATIFQEWQRMKDEVSAVAATTSSFLSRENCGILIHSACCRLVDHHNIIIIIHG